MDIEKAIQKRKKKSQKLPISCRNHVDDIAVSMGLKRKSSVDDDAIVAKHEDVSNLVKTAVESDARHALV
jgi:hypothetical protein